MTQSPPQRPHLLTIITLGHRDSTMNLNMTQTSALNSIPTQGLMESGSGQWQGGWSGGQGCGRPRRSISGTSFQEIPMKRGRRSQEDSRYGTEGPWYEHEE